MYWIVPFPWKSRWFLEGVWYGRWDSQPKAVNEANAPSKLLRKAPGDAESLNQHMPTSNLQFINVWMIDPYFQYVLMIFMVSWSQNCQVDVSIVSIAGHFGRNSTFFDHPPGPGIDSEAPAAEPRPRPSSEGCGSHAADLIHHGSIMATVSTGRTCWYEIYMLIEKQVCLSLWHELSWLATMNHEFRSENKDSVRHSSLASSSHL